MRLKSVSYTHLDVYKRQADECGKTQYLCIGEDTTDIVLESGEIVAKCENYKYLGINFNKEGTNDTEIKCRVNKARTIIKSLNGIPVSYTHLDVYKRQNFTC